MFYLDVQLRTVCLSPVDVTSFEKSGNIMVECYKNEEEITLHWHLPMKRF
jgi:hypothetical protein